MTAPNSPEEQQSNRKLSSRATNFLLSMGSSAGQINQTGPVATNSVESPEAVVAETAPVVETETADPSRKTGVISSTIYPAQRNQPQTGAPAAARTNQLGASTPAGAKQNKTSKSLSPVEKAKLQDEKMIIWLSVLPMS